MGADGLLTACYAASMEPKSSVPENAIGRILTAAEVAAIFRVDVRTVRRYYEAFGGVRIGRTIRFYENRIVSMNDAYLYSKEKGRFEALERPGLDGRQNGGSEVVRQHKGRSAGRNRLGRADQEGLAGGKEAECRTASPDPYGLLPPIPEDAEHP